MSVIRRILTADARLNHLGPTSPAGQAVRHGRADGNDQIRLDQQPIDLDRRTVHSPAQIDQGLGVRPAVVDYLISVGYLCSNLAHSLFLGQRTVRAGGNQETYLQGVSFHLQLFQQRGQHLIHRRGPGVVINQHQDPLSCPDQVAQGRFAHWRTQCLAHRHGGVPHASSIARLQHVEQVPAWHAE